MRKEKEVVQYYEIRDDKDGLYGCMVEDYKKGILPKMNGKKHKIENIVTMEKDTKKFLRREKI